MLIDKTQGALDAVKSLAKQAGAHEALQDKLSYLDQYGLGKFDCEVYSWEDHSFYLHMVHSGGNNTLWHGGLVYRGPGLETNSMPSEHSWGVHT
jgi:hypothetical protein